MGKNTNGQNIITQQHNTTQHDKIFLEPTVMRYTQDKYNTGCRIQIRL